MQKGFGICGMCGSRYDVRIDHKCDKDLCCGEWQEVKANGTRIEHTEAKEAYEAEKERVRIEEEKVVSPTPDTL